MQAHTSPLWRELFGCDRVLELRAGLVMRRLADDAIALFTPPPPPGRRRLVLATPLHFALTLLFLPHVMPALRLLWIGHRPLACACDDDALRRKSLRGRPSTERCGHRLPCPAHTVVLTCSPTSPHCVVSGADPMKSMRFIFTGNRPRYRRHQVHHFVAGIDALRRNGSCGKSSN